MFGIFFLLPCLLYNNAWFNVQMLCILSLRSTNLHHDYIACTCERERACVLHGRAYVWLTLCNLYVLFRSFQNQNQNQMLYNKCSSVPILQICWCFHAYTEHSFRYLNIILNTMQLFFSVFQTVICSLIHLY